MAAILIAEDEARIASFIDKGLRAAGHTTTVAADGRQALEDAASGEFDLIILDIGLPTMSGFEVLDHIRKVSKVPVILLTARGQETDKVRGLRGGADDYVTKPFGVQELFARIDAVMRRSEVVTTTAKTTFVPAQRQPR